MKFSHSLKFNAVPEWSSKYISYNTLKKLIYSLQRDSLRRPDIETHLLETDTSVFTAALDAELSKIDDFFRKREREIFASVDELVEDLQNERPKRRSSNGSLRQTTTDGEDLEEAEEADDDDIGFSPILSDTRVLLRKRIINSYTSVEELRSFVELNHTGFKKALKKFDKSLDTNIKDRYLEGLEKSYVFSKETLHKIEQYENQLIRLYGEICGSDVETAKTELSIHLREKVVWERNTVWRDMIGMERKSQAAEEKAVEVPSINFVKPAVIAVVTGVLLQMKTFSDPAQQNCLALVVCASLLWATEAVPLFVTSLLIPLMIVCLHVLKDSDGHRLDSVASSQYILGQMWNSVILLLLGGFTLAAALSKYSIAKLISTWILSKAGTRPPVVLLTVMGVALFASMWVSNVAAPVLCYSIVQPLLRTLPKNSPFTSALILGIALASNVGGMASPIASPQNIVAIGEMDPPPSWGQWFVISLPVCTCSLVAIWAFLIATFDCSGKKTVLVPIRTIDAKFSAVQWYVIGVTVLTIALWCVAARLAPVFGEMGIIALLPLLLFFGPGLLTTEDFNNYPWNIVVLAMGGTALGKAVASSGLLKTIAVGIQREVEGFSLFGVTLTFGVLILFMATFVSHTVAALIIIPLVKEVGNSMDEPHPRLLITAAALLCSAAMGLPTSGFPNVTAICMTDDFGKPYLTVGVFVTRGVPSSVLAFGVVVTVGYVIMRLVGF